ASARAVRMCTRAEDSRYDRTFHHSDFPEPGLRFSLPSPFRSNPSSGCIRCFQSARDRLLAIIAEEMAPFSL
ncbi:hypothetical protein PMAYCL1PPCAC_06192, partial [Pristionchus mayeri]